MSGRSAQECRVRLLHFDARQFHVKQRDRQQQSVARLPMERTLKADAM